MAEALDNIDGSGFGGHFFFCVWKNQSYRRINTVTAMDRTRLIPEGKKINRKLRKKKKKNKMSRGDFCGSVRAQQTNKSLRMALVLLLHPRSPIRFRVNKFLSAEMKRPAEKSGRPKCTEKPVISVLASVYQRFIIIA